MVDLDWSKRAMESIPLSSEDQMKKRLVYQLRRSRREGVKASNPVSNPVSKFGIWAITEIWNLHTGMFVWNWRASGVTTNKQLTYDDLTLHDQSRSR